MKTYFNTDGFNRWKKIYGETDEVNKVQLDIRQGHAQTVEKVLGWLDAEGGVKGTTVCDAGCGTGEACSLQHESPDSLLHILVSTCRPPLLRMLSGQAADRPVCPSCSSSLDRAVKPWLDSSCVPSLCAIISKVSAASRLQQA